MYVTYEKPEKSRSSIMGEATLPMINFEVNNKEVNYIHGYTMDMDISFMRDSLTVVDESGKINFNILRYDNNIVDINYEIRTLNGDRLIEDEGIENWQIDGEFISTTIQLSSLVKYGTEYMLIIKLSTENEGNINYYTRLLRLKENDIEEHISFVQYFSDAAMDKEKAQEINKYREYDSSVPQNNLGYVDIYCSQDQLSWGNLVVEQITKPMITIKEMYSVFGEYTLEYVVRATNDYDTYQYYNVKEYFRLRKGTTEMYVYSYERSVNQIFEANTQNISESRINLGIDSDLQIEHLTSDNGSYVCFVKEGSLWCMNLRSNRATSIFSFASDDYSDLRDNYLSNGIDIISVDNKGNIVFLLYGYMNKGEHEGKNGVSIFRYDSDKNKVNEIFFVQSNKAYEILKETAGRLAYVNENNVVYIMLEDSIYTINLESNESMQLVSGLDEGNFAINDKNTIIAWHENGKIYEADSLRIVNIITGDDYKIPAGKGEYIKELGFIGDDFIYGLAKKDDISTNTAGKVTFPMYKLVIDINSKNNSKETYEKENIYITDIEIADNMIMLSRAKKTESGFEAVSADRYINSNFEDNTSAELSTIVTDLKKTELVLDFAYTITSSNKLRTGYPKEVTFGGMEGLAVNETSAEAGKYYVYARGRMYGRYHDAGDALRIANDMYGIVVDSHGTFVWGRILRDNVSYIDNIILKGDNDNTLTKALKTMMYYSGEDISGIESDMAIDDVRLLTKEKNFLDFSGGELLNSVYYIANNSPVITKIGKEYVILTGYEGTLTSIDRFTVLNVTTGEKTVYTTEKLEELTKKEDSVFYTVY